MSWSVEQLTILIQEYEKNSILYDTKSPKYHNKFLRQKAIESIKDVVQVLRSGVKDVEIQRKINGLRSTYAAERRKYLASFKSGAGTDEIYSPTIWYYSKLAFLNDHLNVRKTVSNLNIPLSVETSSTPLADVQEVSIDDTSLFSPGSSTSIEAFFSPTESEIIEITNSPCTPTIIEPVKSVDKENTTPTKRKMRKLNKNFEFENVATNAMLDISNAVKTFAQPMSQTKSNTEDEAYGEYVTKSLAALQDKRLKIETKHKINNILYEAALADLQ